MAGAGGVSGSSALRPPFPWKTMEEEVRPLLLASPVLRPLLEAASLREGSFKVIGDRWLLRARYRPSVTAPQVEARIADADWWERKRWGEDRAVYLAARLAAELRALWERQAITVEDE